MTLSPSAKYLLNCIGDTEAPLGYGTVYGNKQSRLSKPLTQWTVGQIIAAVPSFNARFGSSACGRYQFMRDTLRGLVPKVPGLLNMQFTPELQDMLGLMLLKRRGWDKFVAGNLSVVAFGKALAQEWASFPVLADTKGAHRDVVRGQSFYAGDGLNKALISPQKVETWLGNVRAMVSGPIPAQQAAVAEFIPAGPDVPQTTFLPPADASGSAKGIASKFWALVQGKPPVVQAERAGVTQEAKAELPHIAGALSGLRFAGIGGLFASIAGGAQDTGLLGSVQSTADQATQTFQSLQTLVNIVLGAIRWGVTHWWVFGLVISLYVLAKVGWAVYGVWMQVQQWRTTNATLDALKERTGG